MHRFIICASFLLAPAFAGAQSALPASPTQTQLVAGAVGGTGVAATGPRIENARLGVAPASASQELAMNVTAAQPRMGQAMALMIVGGAALLTGLIIGDDAGTVLALGGAVVGLIGLYQYLK